MKSVYLHILKYKTKQNKTKQNKSNASVFYYYSFYRSIFYDSFKSTLRRNKNKQVMRVYLYNKNHADLD